MKRVRHGPTTTTVAAKSATRRVKAKTVDKVAPDLEKSSPKIRVPGKKDLFEHYRQEGDDDAIGPEGVERLCADLGVDPADRKVLLLAWKMGAQRMGYFSRQEFRQGMRVLNATTLAALRKALPGLEEAVNGRPVPQQDFYQYAFRYCLMEKQQKFIDVETAAQMLGLALPEGRHTARFCSFLGAQSEYKVVSSDQWLGFLRFSQEVKQDLSNFDDSQAWPLLLDNYVDWVKDQGP